MGDSTQRGQVGKEPLPSHPKNYNVAAIATGQTGELDRVKLLIFAKPVHRWNPILIKIHRALCRMWWAIFKMYGGGGDTVSSWDTTMQKCPSKRICLTQLSKYCSNQISSSFQRTGSHWGNFQAADWKQCGLGTQVGESPAKQHWDLTHSWHKQTSLEEELPLKPNWESLQVWRGQDCNS